MKRKIILWIASIAALVIGATAAFDVFGMDSTLYLSCCVDWVKGFTGHSDVGFMLASVGGLGVPAAVKEKLDELMRLQNKVQTDVESAIEKQKTDLQGVSEEVQKMERVNGDVAKNIDDINKAMKEFNNSQERREKLLKDIQSDMEEHEKRINEYEALTKKSGERTVELWTPGQRFIASDQYKDSMKRNRSEVDQVLVEFFPIRALKRLIESGWTPEMLKSLSGADASAGPLADSRRLQGVITEPEISLNVQDLIPVTVIEEGSVDWVREDPNTSTIEGGAGVHAEQSDTDSLTEKAEVDIVFSLQEATMRTIAAWIAATKNILKDSRRTQLRSYIDRRLLYALDLELEDQILLGDGTGQNFTGLVPSATAYAGGYAQIQGADPSKIDTLRRAKTQARLAEYPVTGYVLHPDDWEDIELTKGSDLHYIFAMPGVMGMPRLWGVPVADSTRMTSGEFLVGAFALGAELFTQGDATIEATRSHRNWFTANLLAILAEMRATLAIYRSLAFISGPFVEGSGSGS